MRTAGVGVVHDPYVVASRLMPHHRGNGIGHGAEMHRDVLGLRGHPPTFVEQRRGAVTPLLDVRGERRSDEHGSHLLGDGAEERAENLALNVHVLVTIHVAPSLTPTHPGGIHSVEPSSSTRAAPAAVRGS